MKLTLLEIKSTGATIIYKVEIQGPDGPTIGFMDSFQLWKLIDKDYLIDSFAQLGKKNWIKVEK